MPKITKRELAQQERAEFLKASLDRGIAEVTENPIVEKVFTVVDYLMARKESKQSPTEGFWYSQLVRSLGSISANLAEGVGRGYGWDNIRFLTIARGSAYESYVHSRFAYDRELEEYILELCELIDTNLRVLLSKIERGEANQEETLLE